MVTFRMYCERVHDYFFFASSGGEALTVASADASAAAGPEPGVLDPLAVQATQEATIIYVELEENEVDFKKDQIVGGVIHLDLLFLPNPPVVVKKWTIRDGQSTHQALSEHSCVSLTLSRFILNSHQ